MASQSKIKTINDLPNELLFEIFRYLDTECARYVHLRSKRFRYFDPLSRVNRRLRSVALVFLWRDVVCRTADDLKRIMNLLTCDVENVSGYLDNDALILKAKSLGETASHVRSATHYVTYLSGLTA
jgi:hypothetical protein